MHIISNFKKFAQNTVKTDDQGAKNKLFLVNMGISSACASALFLFSKDDKVAQQTAFQDVIINSNNLLRSLEDGKPTANLIEGIKETTVFSALVGLVLSNTAEYFKSTTGDVAAALSVPVLAHFAGKQVNKIFPTEKKEPKEIDPDQEHKKRFTSHSAVMLASAIKAKIYLDNLKEGNGHTSNALFLSSLFNSLKTLATTEQSYSKNEPLRSTKEVTGIVFDGVVSPYITKGIISLAKKAHLSNGIGMVVAQSLIGGVVASGLLNGVTNLLDSALGKAYDFLPDKFKKTENS